MKKVAFLDYSKIYGGAERVLYNVIAHIDRSKYEPILIFPYPMEHQKRYAALECETLYLSPALSWRMGSDYWKHPLRGTDFLYRTEMGLRLAKIVRQKKIDIVDVNLMRRDVKMWVWATNKFTSANIVGHFRSQSQDFVASASSQKLFDVIACVSKFSRMRFRLKGDHTSSVVLYDSVDVDIMKCDKSIEEAKKSLGYDKDTQLIVSVGQLSIHKGHDTAIRAFARLSDKYPSARLLIAGGGDSEFTNYYKQLANELGVKDKVAIPGKQLSDIQTIYRAADLTLSLTKVGEAFGLVPYESALIGTPFIAPSFGAICEFVSDMESGLLVDTNDLNAVTDKIEYALNNPEATYKMVQQLQTIINQYLRPEVLATNLDKLYSEL